MMIRCLCILTMLITPFITAARTSATDHDFAASSVLSNGRWYKIKVHQSGIYRLTFQDLAEMGFSNPGDISLFGNGGKMLPLLNGVPRNDDLVENPVYMFKGTDGVFNQGDYILFYAEGPVTWNYNEDAEMFIHTMHQYSDASYYFITDAGQKLRINERPAIAGTPATDIRTFTDYSYHEINRYNFLKSGRQWFGDRIDLQVYDTVFTFAGLERTSPLRIRINVAGRSSGERVFTLRNGNSVIGTLTTSGVNLQNKTGSWATQSKSVFDFIANDDQVNLKLSFNKSGSDDEAYLDYLSINAKRSLSLTGDMLFFREKSAGNEIVRYLIENCTPQTVVWDITNPANPVKVPAQLTGNTLVFTDSSNTLHQYVALKTGAVFPEPVDNGENTGVIPNQDLHSLGSCNMIIVTHSNFSEAADSIAEFHRQTDGLSVSIATTEQIYNEFSSGIPDVSAVRDFTKMIYDRATGPADQLRYLLLIGDGSYNNMLKSQGNSNFILTYQSENSLHAISSYVSDDFFGLMEDGEGGSTFMEDFSLDIGVGRLPVKTAEEAMNLYRKIRNYNSVPVKGDWQNNILFAGDDQDGNLHMNQADQLADWVENTYPEFAVKRVFLDAYSQVASSTGTRYPDVNRVLKNNFEKGILIFNYTGHGGELGLADERILMREDLSALTNSDRLPLFITATCEFSRFDDLSRDETGSLTENTSAGEFSLLNPEGGSIALVSTTRIVFANENHNLNTRFLQIALSRNDEGEYRTLGESLRMTKNAVGDSHNKLNFILLGDPALRLAIPSYTVVTDSINHRSVRVPPIIKLLNAPLASTCSSIE